MTNFPSRSLRPEFSKPDFLRPLDLAEMRKRIPATATSKGMYLNASAKRIRVFGQTPVHDQSFVAFKDYPAAWAFDLSAQEARAAYPHEPLREALRRVGRLAYDDLKTSMVGRVIFGVLGKDIRAIIRLASKGYALSGSPQSATTLEVGEQHALVRLNDVYMYLDTLHFGVFEGVIAACDKRGEVSMKMLTESSAEFLMEWER